MADSELNPEDIFNILVASDIHLGYNEQDPQRGEDSFNTFEEILQLAQKHDVDFVLLGGDLFHDVKPSPKCMHRCIDLLRKYCMGDKPINFEFLSDQKKVFGHCSQSLVNYEDPNLNVSIPVFSIHGNHDDPIGERMISSLDILSSSGLVNYFGKWLNLTGVEITPMLMQKGQTRLAVYGLGHIKDARLCRLFEEEKVKVLRPTEYTDDWFNIMVLHQNRADRGHKNYIDEKVLPQYLDLVVWGHEHDCRIEPEHNAAMAFYVSQPGSPVATSLSEGEAIPKKVGLLKIFQKTFKLVPLKLKTVRPFVYRHKSVLDLDILHGVEHPHKQLELWAKDEVNNMLKEARQLLTEHIKQPKLPLIRLKIGFSNEDQMFSAIRFGQYFEEVIANSSEIIKFSREKREAREKRLVLDEDVLKDILEDENLTFESRVEDYVKNYFNEVENKEEFALKVLSVAGLNEAVVHFVDKQDKDAVDEILRYQIKRVVQFLQERDITEDNVEDEITYYRDQRQAPGKNKREEQREIEEVRNHLETTLTSRSKKKGNARMDEDVDIFVDEEDQGASASLNSSAIPPAAGGRGRGSRGGGGGRGRGARAPRAPRAPRGGRGRGTSQQTLAESFNNQSQSQAASRRSGRSSAPNKRYAIESDDSD